MDTKEINVTAEESTEKEAKVNKFAEFVKGNGKKIAAVGGAVLGIAVVAGIAYLAKSQGVKADEVIDAAKDVAETAKDVAPEVVETVAEAK